MEIPIIFYSLSALILVFAGLTIKFKNIFYSLLSAMTVFLLVGVLFYTLGSEYNAVIQIAVYGFAVPVILGIAVMFTNMKSEKTETAEEKTLQRTSRVKYFVFLTGGLFILALVYLVMTSVVITPDSFNFIGETPVSQYEVLQAFGRGIFVKYVWAFELLSVVLTIIAVGLTLFKRAKKGGI